MGRGTVSKLGLARPVWLLTALLVACSMVLASCSSGAPSTTGLTGNQLKYGASPEQNSTITYQPDVVLVGGADSVKSVSSNGLVWTISGSAPNVNKLRPGKILFASSLGVGRVLAVSQSGANKKVVLGPVNITDVVRDGDFSSTTPISLNSVEAYSVPTQPGLLSPMTASTSSAVEEPQGVGTVTLPALQLAAYVKGQWPVAAAPTVALASASGTLPSPTSSAPPGSVGPYHLAPFCCVGGVGVHVSYDENGMQLSITLTLHLDHPKVQFKLDIAGGKLINAGVELTGAGGFGIAVTATTTSGLSGNVPSQRVQIPVDFRVPVGGIALPITVGLNQVFGLTTAFTAKDSAMTASGKFKFGGALGFGIHNGSASVYTPQGTTFVQKLSKTMDLVSIGPASVVIDYAAKLSAQVGLLGFGTGAWYELTVATGLYGSGLSSEFVCKQITLAMFARYGVGYNIPQPVADLVSVFLRLFHAPPIKASGGIVGPSTTILQKFEAVPPIAACAPSGAPSP